MIPGIAQFQQIIWVVNTIMSVMLLVLLAVRKNYRAYPAFTFYIAINLTQGALLYAVYQRRGINGNWRSQVQSERWKCQLPL